MEREKLDKLGNCPKCNKSWDGGYFADIFINQKNNGNIYWKDKPDELIREIVKDDYGSEDAKKSTIIMINDKDAICPHCDYLFLNKDYEML